MPRLHLKSVTLIGTLFFIAIFIFIVITEIANNQLIEIVNNNERIDSRTHTRMAFRLVIPIFICTLNFLLLFSIVRFYQQNNSLSFKLFCLWFLFVSFLAWRIKALTDNGVNLPIVEQWPLATGFILASSFIAIVISILIKKIEHKRELIKSLYQEQAKYASQLSEQLEENTTITELLKEQSERLKALDVAKSRFFAGVSHEFRTPLTLIQGPLTDVLTTKKGELSESSYKSIDLALTQTTHLLDLVEELLDFSRLEAGTFKIQNEEINFSALVGNIIDQLESVAQTKGIQIKRLFCSEQIWLNVDPKQIRKVLINLIINAIKFSPENTQVLVELEMQADTCLVHVKDSGAGISELDIEFIFQPFQQLKNDTIENEGVGLGLSLAREIAQLHGGSLSVESMLERGSCFTLELRLPSANISTGVIPAVANRTSMFQSNAISEPQVGERSLENPTQDKASPGTTILVVEDNVALRRYIVNHLEKDYHVLESKNGETGYKAACSHIPDLIISDVMMPRKNGLELCRQLKSNIETSFIPVILLTALTEDKHHIEGFDAKADDYLAKPFNPEVLKARVMNIIASRNVLAERSKDGENLLLQPKGLINRDKQFAEKFQKIIQEMLSNEGFSVEVLAKHLAMERSTLTRKTQKIFKQSPGECISQARLNRAKALLEKEEGSISDIAFTVGFTSLAHFSHAFKKHCGQTPSKYRSDAFLG